MLGVDAVQHEIRSLQPWIVTGYAVFASQFARRCDFWRGSLKTIGRETRRAEQNRFNEPMLVLCHVQDFTQHGTCSEIRTGVQALDRRHA